MIMARSYKMFGKILQDLGKILGQILQELGKILQYHARSFHDLAGFV
jgi:hypothetical protein